MNYINNTIANVYELMATFWQIMNEYAYSLEENISLDDLVQSFKIKPPKGTA